MIAPVAPCTICGTLTPYDWPVCSACGAQRLLTPSGDHGGFRPIGSPWRRIIATGLDFGMFVAAFIAAGFLPDRIADPAPTQGDEALRAAIVIATMLYFPVALGSTGRTLGKRLVDLHVVTWDGSAVSYPRAAIRDGVIKFIELYILAGACAVAYRWADVPTAGRVAIWVALAIPVMSLGMLFGDGRRLTLHDRGAATVCVQGPPLRETASPPPAPAPPADHDPAASALDPAASAG